VQAQELVADAPAGEIGLEALLAQGGDDAHGGSAGGGVIGRVGG
jgi:hypothetical protein